MVNSPKYLGKNRRINSYATKTDVSPGNSSLKGAKTRLYWCIGILILILILILHTDSTKSV